MKKFISITLISLLTLIITINITVFADGPKIKAKSAILASATTGQVLYEKAPTAKSSPDGLTKILTAIVAYEELGMDEIITVPEEIKNHISALDNTMGLQPGEQITVRDLIKGMIVKSANDASFALAISSSESVEAFVQKMNNKAAELGLENSNFTNVTGVYDENQYTTAADMLLIYHAAFQIPDIINILNSQYVTIPANNLSTERVYWTDNHLISKYKSLDYMDENIDGGKPTYSEAGGYSAAVNGDNGNVSVICIVMNSVLDDDVNCALTDSSALVKYAFDNYQLKTIVKQDAIVCETKLKNARGTRHVLLYASNSLEGLIKKDDNVDENVTTKINLPETISAPIKKDQIVGTVDYIYNNSLIDTVNLIALDDIKVNVLKYIGNGILWFLNLPVIKAIWITALCLFVIYVYLLYRAIKKHKKKKAAQKRKRQTRKIDDDWLI